MSLKNKNNNKQTYTILEVITLLSKNSKLVFERVNDEDFKVYRGNRGDLLISISDKYNKKLIRPLPVFLYLQDKFILINE